jgi:hypothetical protein
MLLASQATNVLDILSFVSSGVVAVLGVIGLIWFSARSRSRHSDDHPPSSIARQLPDSDAKTLSELLQARRDRVAGHRGDKPRRE